LDIEDLEFGDPLGEGSYGTVFAGSYLGTDVAIKKMNVEAMGAQDMAKYLKRELACSKFSHPNLVSFIGVAESDNGAFVYLVTEKMANNLRSLIKSGESLSWKTKINLATDAAKGLAFLHAKNIIHRDIKSKNLLLDDNLKLHICDFGFARTIPKEKSRWTICGTEAWMAPEVILGDPYDKSADIFSLGVVMCELLTERKVQDEFERHPQTFFALDLDHVRELVLSDCPPAMVELTLACCEEDAEKRPTSREVIQKLNEIRTTLLPTPVQRISVPKLTLLAAPKSPKPTAKSPRKPRCSFVELNELGLIFDNEENLEQILFTNFSAAARNSWVTIGYMSDNTLSIMGNGNGGTEELMDSLANDEVQYSLLRIPVVQDGIEQYRDVFIYWTGPNVSVVQRGRKKTHVGAVQQILKPFHADLLAYSKDAFTEEIIRERSEPLSGSHVIE